MRVMMGDYGDDNRSGGDGDMVMVMVISYIVIW